MPYVEIRNYQSITIREPLPEGVVKARREADVIAGAEAKLALKLNPRQRSVVRHRGASADEIYGPAVRLEHGITEVTPGVANVIRAGKKRGLYRHVRVLEANPAGTAPDAPDAPHVLTSGALKHGTEEWARMEAERLAEEAAAAERGEAAAAAPAADAPAPVYKCHICLEDDAAFPSAASLERHIEINHPIDDPALGETDEESLTEADSPAAEADAAAVFGNEF